MKSERQQRRSKAAHKAREEAALRFASWMIGQAAKQRKRSGKGPVKWCNTCSRFHRSQAFCNLFLRSRTAKSGRKVQRWAH